jgi:hypothetical protein
MVKDCVFCRTLRNQIFSLSLKDSGTLAFCDYFVG